VIGIQGNAARVPSHRSHAVLTVLVFALARDRPLAAHAPDATLPAVPTAELVLSRAGTPPVARVAPAKTPVVFAGLVAPTAVRPRPDPEKSHGPARRPRR
jgi:hypothetical protein